MNKAMLSILALFLGIQSGFCQDRINGAKSKVKFEISNFGFNTVEGSFKGMEGSIAFDPTVPQDGFFEVCIKANTVDTENSKRDEHLKTEDFFYVSKFPEICIKSNRITNKSDGYSLTGTLMMRGVSKDVEIPFTFSNNTFSGSLVIDRTDFNVGSNGSMIVGKEVKLEIICALD